MALSYFAFPRFLLVFGGILLQVLLALSKKSQYAAMWNDIENTARWCGRAYKITKHSPHYNGAASEREPRIIGGFHVDDPIPWQASIEKETSPGEWQHICGGSLISEYHILTASHCINSNNRYRVTLGKHRLYSFCLSEQSYEIKPSNIVTHRRYGAVAEHANDIAILRIEQPNGKGARINDRVHPICLPTDFNWEAQMMEPNRGECIVSGFGSINGSMPDVLSSSLRATVVPIHSQRRCDHLYNSHKIYRGGNVPGGRGRGSGKGDYSYLQKNSLQANNFAEKAHGFGGSQQFVDDMLCAGPLTGSKDHCYGDSGGPLACKFKGRYYLVGLVSWGSDCGEPNKPGLYTRVSHYLKWIKNEKTLLGPVQ